LQRRSFLRHTVTAGAAALLPAASLWPQFSPAKNRQTELPALHGNGQAFSLQAAEVRELASALSGPLLTAQDAAYGEVRRVWNGMIDRRPALIARCTNIADIQTAVQFASSHELLVAVRGGGHSISGKAVCDAGLMIDLSLMRGVAVDTASRTATAGPGILLGELDAATQAVGLVTTAGTVSHTGAAGLTLGGGFGRTCRKFGLTCDNLTRARLVTATGDLIQAGEEENPDLLWGLRGGGGNFGVVGSFDYQLHAMDPMILGGTVSFPFEQAAEVLRNYADFCTGAPDELNTDWTIVAPRGQRALVSVEACYIGDEARGEKLIAQLQSFGKPLVSRIRRMEYLKLQRRIDSSTPHGGRYYMKSGFMPDIDSGLMNSLLEQYRLTPGMTLVVTFQQLGGAVGRVPLDATAFSHRDAAYSLLVMAGWEEPAADASNIAEVRRYWRALEPHTQGFYVNSISPEDEPRVRANYRGNYARLAQLKSRYDPANLFRLNANVKPVAG
jgi:FAD/FMN-containing dehydrogenase